VSQTLLFIHLRAQRPMRGDEYPIYGLMMASCLYSFIAVTFMEVSTSELLTV